MYSIQSTATPCATRRIRTCPVCHSIDVEPIAPIPNISLREAAETAWADCWRGRKQMAARHLFRWACVTSANALREKYRCSYCGLGFREDAR